jgi:hypothetical protein
LKDAEENAVTVEVQTHEKLFYMVMQACHQFSLLPEK